MDGILSDVFSTTPMEIIDTDGKVIPQPQEGLSQSDADADNARSNIYGLIDQGSNALDYAIELAKSSDSPRAFEVVGTLLKTIADMNSQLLDIHSKKQALNKKQEVQTDGPQKVVNNSIVFQGSTTDLQRMLKDMRKTNEE